MTVAPGIVGEVITDLIDRGLSRDEIADMLKVKPSHVSNIRAGKSSVHDGKLGVLAERHGGYTAKELKVLKYLEWLKREADISTNDILEVLSQNQSSADKRKIA